MREVHTALLQCARGEGIPGIPPLNIAENPPPDEGPVAEPEPQADVAKDPGAISLHPFQIVEDTKSHRCCSCDQHTTSSWTTMRPIQQHGSCPENFDHKFLC